MSATRWAAFVLVVLGTLGLGYGAVEYTRLVRGARLLQVDRTLEQQRAAGSRMLVGTGALLTGVLLLSARTRT
jgi:hypothetical protein